MKTWYIGLIIICVFTSCRLNKEPDTKTALSELVKKYPEIYGNGLIDHYKLIRKFYNSLDSVEMQLIDESNSENEIVVLSNNNGKICAIPFPDNDYRAYWRFYGENLNHSYGERNFNSEMHRAFTFLSIKEGWKKGIIFNDIMFSLMQARPIFPVDSSDLKWKPKEYADSCSVIVKKNSQAIFDRLEGSLFYLNTFSDFRKGRSFQFNSDRPYGSPGFKITVYRQPCIIKPIYL